VTFILMNLVKLLKIIGPCRAHMADGHSTSDWYATALVELASL